MQKNLLNYLPTDKHQILFLYMYQIIHTFLRYHYLLFVLFFLALPIQAAAHPHMFVFTQFTLVFDEQGLASIKVLWDFDEMYSVTTVESFDENQDGIFNPEEAEELARIGVESLADFNYFTNITIGKKPYPVQRVENMKVEFKNNHLLYSFTVPCPVKIADSPTSIKISPYDNEFFAAMFFSEQQPVIYENSDAFSIESSIAKDPDTLIYFDSLNPFALTLSIKKK